MKTLEDLSERESSLSKMERMQLARARLFCWCDRDAKTTRVGEAPVIAVGDGLLLLSATTGVNEAPAVRLDETARQSIADAREAVTQGLDLVSSVLPASVSLRLVYSSDGKLDLRGRSGGLSIALAYWSALVECPLPADLAFSAEVDARGYVRPVRSVPEKAAQLRANAGTVRRLMVARDQPEEDLAKVRRAGLEPLCVSSLEDAAAQAMPGATSRFSAAAHQHHRNWVAQRDNLRHGTRAALAARLAGTPKKVREIVAQIHPRVEVTKAATDEQLAALVEFKLALGDFNQAKSALVRLRSRWPSHPLARRDEYESLRVRALDAFRGDDDDPPIEIPTSYHPAPIETADVQVPKALDNMVERLAENVHDHWAARRFREGWTCGPRDDARRTNPCLVPYDDLPESEKDYDRVTMMETVKAMLALGYHITPPRG